MEVSSYYETQSYWYVFCVQIMDRVLDAEGHATFGLPW
jgi:hypothetical protein